LEAPAAITATATAPAGGMTPASEIRVLALATTKLDK